MSKTPTKSLIAVALKRQTLGFGNFARKFHIRSTCSIKERVLKNVVTFAKKIRKTQIPINHNFLQAIKSRKLKLGMKVQLYTI